MQYRGKVGGGAVHGGSDAEGAALPECGKFWKVLTGNEVLRQTRALMEECFMQLRTGRSVGTKVLWRGRAWRLREAASVAGTERARVRQT